MNIVTEKLKDILKSVLPVIIIVLLLNFTLTPLETPVIIKFIAGALLIIAGLVFFLIGVDIGITPLGTLMGSVLTKTNKMWIIAVAGIVLGFFISVAEPGLLILANQVDVVTSGNISSISILIVVSIGLAIMLALGFVRTVYNFPLYKLLTILYVITFGLSVFSSREFLAIGFDASGATTGVLAVPFILALAVGISSLKKDSKASEKDSFGLVAVASVGAIMSVLILDIFTKGQQFSAVLGVEEGQQLSIIGSFLKIAPGILRDCFFSLLPLLVIFLVFQKISFKLGRRAFRKILIGFVYAYIGLFLFLMGVNAGFMDVGTFIGKSLASFENKYYIIVIAFIIGLVTILAEPAVYVLTHQIDDVTSGYVKRSAVLIALSVGVGFAVALSVVRILVPELQLWHFLLPGYVISIGLSYIVPKLFVGIAFDAGGVATGPMTATFILAFTQGAADAAEGASVLVDGFGMISLVALFPIITLQILGLIFKIKSQKGGIENAE